MVAELLSCAPTLVCRSPSRERDGQSRLGPGGVEPQANGRREPHRPPFLLMKLCTVGGVVTSRAGSPAASSTPDSPTAAGTTPCAARAPGGASWTGNSPTAKRQAGPPPVIRRNGAASSVRRLGSARERGQA